MRPTIAIYFDHIPLKEYCNIYRQLSDVTKDGALSLNEFCTAMHLVVLRRNRIALPKQLPPVLDPLLMAEPTVPVPPPPPPVVVPSTMEVKEANGPTSTAAALAKPVSAPSSSAVDGAGTSQHWTKFVDSPTGSVASPGPQPVNFDFKRAQVEQDPRILHPVALRLTPESQLQHQSSTELGPSSGAASLPPASAGSALGTTLSSSNNVGSSMGKKEPPPPPPPRPYRGHARSSSLDLNQLGTLHILEQNEKYLFLTSFVDVLNAGRNSGLNAAAPPAVPPRVSPSMVHHSCVPTHVEKH